MLHILFAPNTILGPVQSAVKRASNKKSSPSSATAFKRMSGQEEHVWGTEQSQQITCVCLYVCLFVNYGSVSLLSAAAAAAAAAFWEMYFGWQPKLC